MLKNCAVCGNAFEKRHSETKTCSKTCTNILHGQVKRKETSIKLDINCPHCGYPIYQYKNIKHLSYQKQFYCGSCSKMIAAYKINKIKPSLQYAISFSKKGLKSNNTSGYKGVSFCKRRGKYFAKIHKEGKRYILGAFVKAEDAAIAYNLKALELYGPTAFQNDITKPRDPKEYEYGTKGHNPYVECST